MLALHNRDMGATESELLLGLVVILAVLLYAMVLILRRLSAGPREPDPWNSEVAAEIESPDTPLLCHRCLLPNDPGADFCHECGAPIGQYTNYLPFPNLFSLGHTLRLGTSGEYKRTPVTVLGYVLLALGEYLIFAPVYLYQLFRKLPPKPQSHATA